MFANNLDQIRAIQTERFQLVQSGQNARPIAAQIKLALGKLMIKTGYVLVSKPQPSF
jgi:hypothetical protein